MLFLRIMKRLRGDTLMIKTFWTETQSEELKKYCETNHIPVLVQENIRSTIKILDDNYGVGRTLEADGGYIAVLVTDNRNNVQEEYKKLLAKYHMTTECREFHDVIGEISSKIYYSDLFIINSEYALTIIWYEERKGF